MKNKKTFLLITLGVALLMIGFFFLAQGPANNPLSLTVAPIILVFAYLVVIPIGILWGSKESETKGDQLSWFRAAALQAAGQRFESVIAHFTHQGWQLNLVRAPACHAGGCEFKSRLSRKKSLLKRRLFFLFKRKCVFYISLVFYFFFYLFFLYQPSLFLT